MKKYKNILILIVSIFLFGFINMQEDVWKAPEKAKQIKNPTTDIASSIVRGKKIYRSRCAVCHGIKGLGDGPGAKALEPKPKSLTSTLVKSETDGEMYWKITNGRNDMIKWGPILSDQKRWDLVNYVRELSK